MVNTPKAPKSQPNPQGNEQQTSETAVPTNKDTVPRVQDNVLKVLNTTGSLPDDTKTLVAETLDQLRTEAQSEDYRRDVKLDTLTLEQIDHQKTLEHALGLTNGAVNNDELMESAKKRVDGLKDRKRDTSKDNVHNSIPANWRVENIGNGQIRGLNIITGKTYEGEPKGMLKAD